MTGTLEQRAAQNAVERNGVMIARTPNGVAVGVPGLLPRAVPVTARLEYEDAEEGGRWVKEVPLTFSEPFYRDYFGPKVDHLRLGVKVVDSDGVTVLAELPAPDAPLLPFMRRTGEQRHVTENYVAVPPALTITDEVGAVWTLGLKTAPPEKSPRGEFAFEVLRDGVGTGEIASRIERRNGQVRIFTRRGWKRWLGSSFS